MHIFISKEQREKLLNQHRREKNGKIRDRIKSVLLSDQGWTYRSISEALFLDEETISTHVREFRDKAKLRNNSGGSSANLSVEQSDSLVNHIESSLYLESNIIRRYVENTYDVKFSKSGMISWLHDHNFSYKKPNRVPAKADKSR